MVRRISKKGLRTEVKGHYMHRDGKSIWIPEHIMRENKRIHKKHEQRLNNEIHTLRKMKHQKGNNAYGMGLDIQTTKNHPGYSENLSASENYKKGLEFAKKHGYSKLWVARSLEQLANLTHKPVYKQASAEAFEKYDRGK